LFLIDLAGMTAAFEATLALELKIPYAVVAMVDNMGHGIQAQEFTYEEFKKGLHENQKVVDRVCLLLVNYLKGKQ
jgi:purine nucleoside phosphorylase